MSVMLEIIERKLRILEGVKDPKQKVALQREIDAMLMVNKAAMGSGRRTK